MAQQTINVGTAPNDGTGTPLRTAFQYTNSNFSELYTAVGPSGNNIVVPGSATITGDLTVDTSTLKVDSTNNRVGIGTATPAEALTVAGKIRSVSSTFGLSDVIAETTAGTGTGYARLIVKTADREWRLINDASTSGSPFIIYDATANAESLRIATAGVFTFGDGAGGTRMTLNSTGLGVGTASHSTRLGVVDAGNTFAATFRGNGGTNFVAIGTTGFGASINGYTAGFASAADLVLQPNGGNVGIGVTPSAWSNSGNIDLANGFIGISSSGTYGGAIANNAYYNAGWKYKAANYANLYLTGAGEHKWLNAPVGAAAGNAITFTQAMTLDASGRLLVGVTSAIASGNTFQNLGSARQVLTLKGDDQTSYTFGVWSASATGDNLFQYFGTEATLTVRGSISYNRAGGLVAYNTTSDYRAKDIIGPVSNSGSLIDSLKVYVGKMKGATIERPMLIAHEAQEVAPYAVTGTKDEVDSDGKPKYQQMDASALVPLLIAEIQSLRARVQTLETR